jgi:peptide/nickel transport system substrate-binding protein
MLSLFRGAAAVLALAAGVSGAIAQDAPSPHTLAGVLSAANNEGPKTAKHLTIGIWNTASNLTTYTIGNSWNDWILYTVSEKLLEPSPYLSNGHPWLATEVVQIDDEGRIWEAEIRQGVKWHDGTEMTAEDVAFTYNLYLNGPANRWTHHVSDVPRIEKIEAIGPYRVRFEAPRPMPNFDLVTAPEMPILQKKQWEGIEDPRTMLDPVIGTGPYKMADYKADEYYHLVAFDDYWGGKPAVDEITLVMIKDPQTMFAALKSGEIDGAARALPPELVAEWKNDPAIEIVQAPTLWGTWMQMNLNDPLFNNRDLRYAISLAVDGDTLVDRVMLGRAQSGKHGWPHLDSTWTKPGMSVPYDVEQAKAGLDAVGMVDKDGDGSRDKPDGTPIDFRIVVSTNQPLYVRAAEIMVEQLAAVGLKSHVEAVDTATFNNLTADGNYEFSIAEITPHGLADQDQYLQFYSGAQMKKLLEKANPSVSRSTMPGGKPRPARRARMPTSRCRTTRTATRAASCSGTRMACSPTAGRATTTTCRRPATASTTSTRSSRTRRAQASPRRSKRCSQTNLSETGGAGSARAAHHCCRYRCSTTSASSGSTPSRCSRR